MVAVDRASRRVASAHVAHCADQHDTKRQRSPPQPGEPSASFGGQHPTFVKAIGTGDRRHVAGVRRIPRAVVGEEPFDQWQKMLGNGGAMYGRRWVWNRSGTESMGGEARLPPAGHSCTVRKVRKSHMVRIRDSQIDDHPKRPTSAAKTNVRRSQSGDAWAGKPYGMPPTRLQKTQVETEHVQGIGGDPTSKTVRRKQRSRINAANFRCDQRRYAAQRSLIGEIDRQRVSIFLNPGSGPRDSYAQGRPRWPRLFADTGDAVGEGRAASASGRAVAIRYPQAGACRRAPTKSAMDCKNCHVRMSITVWLTSAVKRSKKVGGQVTSYISRLSGLPPPRQVGFAFSFR